VSIEQRDAQALRQGAEWGTSRLSVEAREQVDGRELTNGSYTDASGTQALSEQHDTVLLYRQLTGKYSIMGSRRGHDSSAVPNVLTCDRFSGSPALRLSGTQVQVLQYPREVIWEGCLEYWPPWRHYPLGLSRND
jgi:hypothetical protein